MNALPLVSVVVPNYNYKRYLNLRIQSILQQTYQNIELILLDDASTDGSEEVLSDYQDHAKVSHILLNEHNTGNPFKQWFKGMQLAIRESSSFNGEIPTSRRMLCRFQVY